MIFREVLPSVTLKLGKKMEDTMGYLFLNVLPFVLLIALVLIVCRLYGHIVKLQLENTDQLVACSRNWQLWEQILTDKKMRMVIGEIDTFSGTDSDACRLACSEAFISYIKLLEKLLNQSKSMNRQNYLACLMLVYAIYRIPVLRYALCNQAVEYPRLMEIIAYLKS